MTTRGRFRGTYLTVLVLSVALWGLLHPSSADRAVPQVMLPLMVAAPTIDGAIDEAEWAGAVRQVGLVSQHNGLLGPREAVFWVGSDGQSLFIALKTELPPGGDLLTRAVPDGDRDITAALHDDTVELILHPHLTLTAGDQRFFHIIVNARGAMFDRALDPANAQNPVSTAWRLKDWQFANQTVGGYWHVEAAIPFAAIGATADDLKHPWGLRVCRNWQRPWDQSRWESVITAYEDLPSIPQVTFAAGAPVVQVLGLRGPEKPRIELAIHNPGGEALPVSVFVSDTWSRNPPNETTRELTIAPGAREVVAVEPPHGGAEGAHQTILRVTSPDGQRTYYLRDFGWYYEVPAERWETVKEDQQAIALQYKVYPYYRKLKARVSINALAARDGVTGVQVAFVRKGGEKPLATMDLKFADYVAEGILDLPELGAGEYLVQATLQGGAGVPDEPATGEYERKVFPWEHNDLGKSTIVISPFTPIAVQGRTVSTVLREHILGGNGVWEQVTSLQEPLLTGPMQWTVSAGGQTVTVQADQLKVVSAQPHAAVTQGGFAAGPLRATVRTDWDYDGMAKVTLKLQSEGARQVDRLSLEIPLADLLCRYMHACGDGLRFNYAGRTPSGQGPIWDSSQANKQNIVGTFYPYLWLGGGERGLAWFADSDRGWSLDDTTPVLQLERNGATLLLRVNFITRPTDLTEPREIVFGLQATPVKPMPEQPVNWRRWLCHNYEDIDVQPFSIVGASYYYGCLSYDFYPREHDLSIYEALSRARDTGEYDQEFVDQWMEGYKPYAEPGSEQWEFFLAHIRSGMSSAAGTKRSEGWLWTPYTNPRGLGFHLEEWPTFQDEWVQLPYLERSRKGAIDYEICPVESLQDAWMWYYKEMMQVFDGIYWDNLYLSANNDTVAGGAWVDEQGRVHPSMGLWAMRDLVKRTAVLFNEQGRPVFSNVVHMTNANLVPIMAFANVNLDWEWQYGKRDFQDRFTPEMAVAETIGRQCGNIPLILAGGFYDDKDPLYPWVMRTRTGVCLVHELKVWDWQPAAHYDLLHKLYQWGYGESDCQVYNYWDPGFPLTTTGSDLKGLVMVRGGKALVVVTDYGEGGDCTVQLDLVRLQLPELTKVSDFESGEAVTSAAPGQASFSLKKHDFKVLAFE